MRRYKMAVDSKSGNFIGDPGDVVSTVHVPGGRTRLIHHSHTRGCYTHSSHVFLHSFTRGCFFKYSTRGSAGAAVEYIHIHVFVNFYINPRWVNGFIETDV